MLEGFYKCFREMNFSIPHAPKSRRELGYTTPLKNESEIGNREGYMVTRSLVAISLDFPFLGLLSYL